MLLEFELFWITGDVDASFSGRASGSRYKCRGATIRPEVADGIEAVVRPTWRMSELKPDISGTAHAVTRTAPALRTMRVKQELKITFTDPSPHLVKDPNLRCG